MCLVRAATATLGTDEVGSIDEAPAEQSISSVEDCRLARRHGGLELVEMDIDIITARIERGGYGRRIVPNANLGVVDLPLL